MKRALVALVFVAGTATAAPVDPLDAAVEAGWKKMAPPAGERGWVSVTTLVLPARLPINASTPLVVYAYGRRYGGVSDGEYVARSWGELTIAPGGAISLRQLSVTLDKLGIQGFRPMMATSMPTDAERAEAKSWMLSRRGGAAPTVVKKIYCGWASGNIVILTALPQTTRNFIATLGCDPKAR